MSEFVVIACRGVYPKFPGHALLFDWSHVPKTKGDGIRRGANATAAGAPPPATPCRKQNFERRRELSGRRENKNTVLARQHVVEPTLAP